MKTKLTLLALLISVVTFAQQGINYKALIKDDNGNVIANDLIIVQFQILQGAGMTNVYQETHTPTTDANGLIMVNISEGTTSDVFTAIDWGADDHYLNVQINTGSGLTDMGTTQFMAVPYALNAANVATKLNDLSDAKSDANGSSLFLGKDAGLNDDGYFGNSNVGVGFKALYSNTTGYGNTATGYTALYNNTTGGDNTATGILALYNNTTGNSNAALGYAALFSNTTGNWNTANGFQALYSNTTGSENTANGSRALRYNTTGNWNTANGFQALHSNTIGQSNTANGRHTLINNTQGDYNTANGHQALFSNTTGNRNTADGSAALTFNTTGNENTANGYNALYSNTTGIRNTASGFEALLSNRTGNYNTGFGYKTLHSQTTGHWNTAIGRNALLNLTAGTNNIGIGYNAQSSSPTASNQVTIGNSSNNVYRMYASSWTNASDSKLKHSITNIPVGLDFVLKLRPVEFIYNNANNEEKTFGFIAQEVQEVVKQSHLEDNILVSPLNEKYLGLRTTELISVLTKAIQEQQDIIDSQNTDIKSLTIELEAQNNSINQLLIRMQQLEVTNNQ